MDYLGVNLGPYSFKTIDQPCIMFRDSEAKMNCKCPRREDGEDYSKKELGILFAHYEKSFWEDALRDECISAVLEAHKAGALNVCKTQKLKMMDVTPMNVELQRHIQR